MAAPDVLAAGGVIHRARDDGAQEIAVIHRPKYDDWTLPKGKLEPGESLEAAAVREVFEETGYRVEVEGRIGETSYRDRNGRPKRVTYYALRPVSGAFAANDEVDELRWVTIEEAEALLDHPHDLDLAHKVVANPPL